MGPLKLALAFLCLATAAALTGSTLSAYSSTAATTGSTFATAASYGTTCSGATVTNGFVSGFETGRRGYSAGTLSTSAPAVYDSAPGAARSGAWALKVATSGTTGFGQWSWNVLPYPAVAVARFAVRLNAQPPADVTQLFHMSNSGLSMVQLRYVRATNRFAVAIRRDATSAFTVVPGTATLQVGTWHVIDFRYNVAGATHTADWRVDGAAQPGASTPAGTTTINQVQFGTNAAETVDAHYDDVLMSRSSGDYPLGDGRVFALRPNGTGTHVNPSHFRTDGGGALTATSWNRLDEAPMDSLTDYVEQFTANASSYAEFHLDDTSETCVRAAHATFATHSPSSNKANDMKISAFDGATESVIRQGDMAANNTVSRDYGAPLTPAAGWTQSAVNGLVIRWGYGADINPLQQLDSVLVEIEAPR
jgi:hypothetical protein